MLMALGQLLFQIEVLLTFPFQLWRAYELVNHPRLIHRAQELKFNLRRIALLIIMYSGPRVLQVGIYVSDAPFRVSQGIIAGCAFATMTIDRHGRIGQHHRNVGYDPGMSEKHGALLIPLTDADVRHSQAGAIAPLYDVTTGIRQYGTVAYTVAMSPNAHEVHDLDALTPREIHVPFSFSEAKQSIERDERRIRQASDDIFLTFLHQDGASKDFLGRTKRSVLDVHLKDFNGKYFATVSARHLEAHQHWILPTGHIFTENVLLRGGIWQIFTFSESPGNELSWHVTYDRRLTMVQVVTRAKTGCVDVLESKQQIRAGHNVSPFDAELAAEVQQAPGWEDDLCLVCHMGHKPRYGMIAGQYAVCPPWKLWAYLTRRIDKTDYGTYMGVLNIFEWDTMDLDAIGLTEPTVGWRHWCYENEDYLPERLDSLLNSIEDEIEEFWNQEKSWPPQKMEGTGLCAIETRVHPVLPPLGAPMAFRGRAMRRRTGSRTPGRGQSTYQDDVTSRVNQYRIRQAAYELVAFFTTVSVSPTHHKADACASCEEQLGPGKDRGKGDYSNWSDRRNDDRVSTATAVHTIPEAHGQYVRVLAWDPFREILISGGGDGHVRFWGPEGRGYAGRGGLDAERSVRSLLVLPEELVSGHSTGEVVLWAMELWGTPRVQTLQAHLE
ncbi:unnamed protein product, partial [Prorocentrum cordatum]